MCNNNKKGGRSKTCANRYVLAYLITIGLNNTEIGKKFHAHRNWVIKWKKFEITSVLLDPPNDIVINNFLKDVLDVCKGMGYWILMMCHYPKELKLIEKDFTLCLKSLKTGLFLTAI